MTNYDELIETVKEQERTLQFEEFTSETALEIGLSIIEHAKEEHLVIAVDIRLNGHQLFHYACQGTAPDNDEWINTKCRIVNRLRRSSYRYNLELERGNQTPADWNLNPAEYPSAGGSFPLTIKNVGVVGTITVSGLEGKDDHATVVWALKKYFSKK